MTKIVSYAALIFLISISTLSSFAKGEINRFVSNKTELLKKTSSAPAEGKRTTYILVGGIPSLNFTVPADQITCDKFFDKFLEDIDFPALEKLGEESHVNYTFAANHVADEAGNYSYCVETKDGKLLVRIAGVIEGIDEIGNAQVEAYVASVKDKKFFNNPISYRKPERIVRSYELGAWGKKRDIGEAEEKYGNLKFYVTYEGLDFIDKEFEQFETAFKSDLNKNPVIEFFNTHFNDLPRVTRAIEKVASWTQGSEISLSADTTYMIAGFSLITVSDIGNSHEASFLECVSVGNCFR
jgi:hypothetical protein